MWQIKEQFARNLKRKIKDRGLSKIEFATKAGLDPTTIYSYLRGDTVPKIGELYLLCKGLEITASELLGF